MQDDQGFEGKSQGRWGTPWFGGKRFGRGFRPTSWQGWLTTFLYLVLLWSAATALRVHHIVLFIAALVVLSALYIAVAMATSRAR